MSKVLVERCEANKDKIISGAVVGVGAGLITMGILKLISAKKMKYVPLEAEDEQMEFEIYKANKEKKLRRKRSRKMRRGICSIVIGAFTAFVGVTLFTPYKKYIIESSVATKIKDADIIGKVKNAEVINKVKDAEIIGRIKEILDRK